MLFADRVITNSVCRVAMFIKNPCFRIIGSVFR